MDKLIEILEDIQPGVDFRNYYHSGRYYPGEF